MVQGAVTDVFEQRNLCQAGIMRYHCEPISSPPQFDSSLAFERFVIAHGLTTDAANLESLKVRLPPQLPPTPPLPARGGAAINYADSKEALT
jgi:hypothetical protein